MEVRLFFEFIQVAIGNRKSLSVAINDSDWQGLFDFCKKQALIGVGFSAVEKLHAVGIVCPAKLRVQWMALALQIEKRNALLNEQCRKLTEEYSVRRFHTPFLGLPYEVWQAGPVVKDVFIDLLGNLVILDGYVTKEVVGDATYILPAKSFSDDEFSDNDLLVMDEVIRKYGDKTAKELPRDTYV